MAGKHGNAQDRADAKALLEARPDLVDPDHPEGVIRKLERWRLEGRLNPLESASQAERTAHWLALVDLMGLGRGKSTPWAALVMAGRGFPTEAYRTPLVRFWEVFEVDEAASPLPPFRGVDNTRSDAEHYAALEELVGRALTDRATTEEEDFGDADRAFDSFVPAIMENLRKGGSEAPLGDFSLIFENATSRMTNFQPTDPNLTPMPDLAAKIVSEESRPSPETMIEAESMLVHTRSPIPELVRVAREEPLESLAQTAAFAYELVQNFELAAGDEEKARALAAVLAPGFIAVLNVSPIATGFLRKRGLLNAPPESMTEDSPT